MLWKRLKLETWLDALFDEAWGCLGLPEAVDAEMQWAGEL